ncbi:MAG: thioredoxin family protein [Planctomycetes bacterium]|nr:thioredoxin family protein [Planctomycetota bacterium]
MLRHAIVLPLLAGLVLAQEESAQDHDLWLQDFAAAKAKAKAEKKDLLVDFTGSDWCIWCKRLDGEVFAKDEFKNSAPDNFVLVKLDFPQDETLVTAEIRAQNEKLQEQYAIQGFPTILLMDHDGRVYAQTGYQQGGPGPYNTMLAEKREKGAAFKAAVAALEGKTGAERAKAIDALLGTVEEEVADNFHFDLMKEICTLDQDGKAGLLEKYEAKVKQKELERATNEAASELRKLVGEHMQNQDGAKAIAALDDYLKTPKSKIHEQMALFFKGMITMDTTGDAKAALELLEKAKAIDTTSLIAQQIEQIMPQIKAQEGQGGGK